jgi:hypothetical protein
MASVGPPAIAASSPESLERAGFFAALADAPGGRRRSSASCTLRASGRTTQAPVKSS